MLHSDAPTYSFHIVVNELTAICGGKFVITDPEAFWEYERDQTQHLHFSFDILVKPGTAEEVAAVLKVCNQYNIPVTPRGGGSGVTGGALPVKGGVVLSMSRLNKIISIHPEEGYVIAEAGVVTAALCNYAAEAGLYFPVAPSSSAYSFVGGNVAENAGSINSCRYGTTGRYVLNLEVALPSGELIWTGANVSKNVTGLNLTQLFVGSEGILGVITKVVYRLITKPRYEVSLLAAYDNLEDACKTVAAIRRSGVSPAAVELIGSNALRITAAYLDERLPFTEEHIKAHLLITLQEETETALLNAMEVMTEVIEQYSNEPLLTGSTTTEKALLWKLRFNIGTALTAGNKTYRDIDICMPVTQLYSYILKVEEICNYYGSRVASFGHALDGNLHTMLIQDRIGNEENEQKALQEIYTYAIANGGVISGEHGIGVLQRPFMHFQFSVPQLALMKGIKGIFDPKGILNPGKKL